MKTCSSGSRSTIRAFRANDVVLLEGLRCSGAEHDGCQKSCAIFWREAWLRKVEGNAVPPDVDSARRRQLQARLKTSIDQKTYFCQASELLKATHDLSRWERIGKCWSDVRAGNCTVSQMARRIGIWLFWRIRRAFLGEYAHGSHRSTPVVTLNLQAGEPVQVKAMADINATLNRAGYNRGLYFSPDMRLLCGEKHLVQGRLDKIIVDGTGEMRELHNTVRLEGSLCGCAHVAFGGCSRQEFTYWRETWLCRAHDA